MTTKYNIKHEGFKVNKNMTEAELIRFSIYERDKNNNKKFKIDIVNDAITYLSLSGYSINEVKK